MAKENTKGLHITLTEEQKRLWDFILAETQNKLGTNLTTQQFLILLMSSYQNTVGNNNTKYQATQEVQTTNTQNINNASVQRHRPFVDNSSQIVTGIKSMNDTTYTKKRQ